MTLSINRFNSCHHNYMLTRCHLAVSIAFPLNPRKKNTVKVLSHSGVAPKALRVKFHLPWPNTGRGSDSLWSRGEMKFMSRNGERILLWCIFCFSPKISVKGVSARMSCLHIVTPNKACHHKYESIFPSMFCSNVYCH